MPESLADTWIEYPTGLRVEPGCSEDAVQVAVPVGTQLPVKSGCGSALDTLVERAGQWLRDLVR